RSGRLRFRIQRVSHAVTESARSSRVRRRWRYRRTRFHLTSHLGENRMTLLSPVASAYVRAINDHDAAAFFELFTDSAVVRDLTREIRGIGAIRAWGEEEI